MPTDISFYCEASVAPEKRDGVCVFVCVCFGGRRDLRKEGEERTEETEHSGRMGKSLKEP